ncbi:MAG: hypothetical protein A3E78_12060 [Alphaproteobacteria bacterium RIFCSPHIGHO2_12_FULL_63_12]|nr:MAG: hypothetical protein A3E78_12060 [Alphaproteobacteria bacterium RIFCSPHIGHO2_12_FULL_63_12]
MTQDYYGTKRVTAWPQERAPGPYGPREMQDGYAVKYEDGYTSWSPRATFEAAYQPVVAMSFGHAIVAMKAGHRVARAGWNGKGMFLFLVPGSVFQVNRPPLLGIYPEGTEIRYHAHIDMKTAQGYVVPWLASQADMLADDWTIIE